MTVDEGECALASIALGFGAVEFASGDDCVIEAESEDAEGVSFATGVALLAVWRTFLTVGRAGKYYSDN